MIVYTMIIAYNDIHILNIQKGIINWTLSNFQL
jgi:hypothetical protein